jgi:hypothetical protein
MAHGAFCSKPCQQRTDGRVAWRIVEADADVLGRGAVPQFEQHLDDFAFTAGQRVGLFAAMLQASMLVLVFVACQVDVDRRS